MEGAIKKSQILSHESFWDVVGMCRVRHVNNREMKKSKDEIQLIYFKDPNKRCNIESNNLRVKEAI